MYYKQGFLALTCLLGPSDEHIKSLQLLDTGKVVNLHKFKMAAVQSFNLQLTFFWLLLDKNKKINKIQICLVYGRINVIQILVNTEWGIANVI